MNLIRLAQLLDDHDVHDLADRLQRIAFIMEPREPVDPSINSRIGPFGYHRTGTNQARSILDSGFDRGVAREYFANFFDQFVDDLSEEGRRRVFSEAERLGIDPDSHPSGPAWNSLIETLAGMWSAEHPEETLIWVSSHPFNDNFGDTALEVELDRMRPVLEDGSFGRAFSYRRSPNEPSIPSSRFRLVPSEDLRTHSSPSDPRWLGREASVRIAGVLDDVPPHWKDQLKTMRDSGRYDRRLIRYLAHQLRKTPEGGQIDEYLRSNAGEAPEGFDPYSSMRPSEVLNGWASENWNRGGFDLTNQPLDQTLSESRSWGSSEGNIKEDLGDGWSIVRTRKQKALRGWGTDLQNCVEKGVHVDSVEDGREEIWVVLRPDGSAAAMFNAKILRDGSRPIEYIMGDANKNPDDETKGRIEIWLEKHPEYVWHGYTPIEEDDTYQFWNDERNRFEENVRNDIPNIRRYMGSWLFSRRFVATIADEIAQQRSLIDPEVLGRLAKEYPEVREALR